MSIELHKELYDEGAWLVPLNEGKRAIVKAFTTERVNKYRVLNHEGNMGIVPKHSGFMVFDMDTGTEDDLWEFMGYFPNSFHYSTPSGGIHLWVKYTGVDLGNKKFYHKSIKGDIRHNAGIVVMWDVGTIFNYVKYSSNLHSSSYKDIAKYIPSARRKATQMFNESTDILYGMHPVSDVIATLDKVLEDWGWRGYEEEWLPMIFSARAGNASEEVLEHILSHPDINWTDYDKQSEEERVRWANEDRGGYNYATLLWMAKGGEEEFVTKDSDELPKFVYTVEEMMAIEPAPPLFVSTGGVPLLPSNGVSMLAGETRTKKTYIAIHWAMQLAAQGKKVVYFLGEGFQDAGSRVKANSYLHHSPATDWSSIRFVDASEAVSHGFSVKKNAQKFMEHIDILDADFAVIDTFRTASGAENENDNSEMVLIVNNLRQMAKSVMIVHHLKKDKSEYSGAGSLNSNTDSYLTISVDEHNPDISIVKVEGHRNMKDSNASVAYLFHEVDNDIAPDEIQNFVITKKGNVSMASRVALLVGEGYDTRAKVQEELDIGSGTANAHLARAVKEGLIGFEKGSRGKKIYYLIEDIDPPTCL